MAKKIHRKRKGDLMKKVFALLLCLALLATMAVGCKKNDKAAQIPSTDKLSTSVLSADLLSKSGLYYYEACGKYDSISNLKVVNKMTTDNVTNVAVTGIARSAYVEVELAANMKYVVKNNQWVLDSVNVTKKVPSVIAAPDTARIQDTISNYISFIGSALAVKDGKEQRLPSFNIKNAKWEMKWENGAKTARLNISYTSDPLTFTGYYTLTFGETGWGYEHKALDDGYRHIVMHLESLEQKDATKK